MTDVSPLLLRAVELCQSAAKRDGVNEPEVIIEEVGGACFLLVQAARLINAPPFNMVDDMAKLPKAFDVPTPPVRKDGTLADLQGEFSTTLSQVPRGIG